MAKKPHQGDEHSQLPDGAQPAPASGATPAKPTPTPRPVPFIPNMSLDDPNDEPVDVEEIVDAEAVEAEAVPDDELPGVAIPMPEAVEDPDEALLVESLPWEEDPSSSVVDAEVVADEEVLGAEAVEVADESVNKAESDIYLADLEEEQPVARPVPPDSDGVGMSSDSEVLLVEDAVLEDEVIPVQSMDSPVLKATAPVSGAVEGTEEVRAEEQPANLASGRMAKNAVESDHVIEGDIPEIVAEAPGSAEVDFRQIFEEPASIAPISAREEAIPLAEGPVSAYEEAIPLAETPVSAHEEAIPLAEHAPAQSGDTQDRAEAEAAPISAASWDEPAQEPVPAEAGSEINLSQLFEETDASSGIHVTEEAAPASGIQAEASAESASVAEESGITEPPVSDVQLASSMFDADSTEAAPASAVSDVAAAEEWEEPAEEAAPASDIAAAALLADASDEPAPASEIVSAEEASAEEIAAEPAPSMNSLVTEEEALEANFAKPASQAPVNSLITEESATEEAFAEEIAAPASQVPADSSFITEEDVSEAEIAEPASAIRADSSFISEESAPPEEMAAPASQVPADSSFITEEDVSEAESAEPAPEIRADSSFISEESAPPEEMAAPIADASGFSSFITEESATEEAFAEEVSESAADVPDYSSLITEESASEEAFAEEGAESAADDPGYSSLITEESATEEAFAEEVAEEAEAASGLAAEEPSAKKRRKAYESWDNVVFDDEVADAAPVSDLTEAAEALEDDVVPEAEEAPESAVAADEDFAEAMPESAVAADEDFAEAMPESAVVADEDFAEAMPESAVAADEDFAEAMPESAIAADEDFAEAMPESAVAADEDIAEAMPESAVAVDEDIAEAMPESAVAVDEDIAEAMPESAVAADEDVAIAEEFAEAAPESAVAADEDFADLISEEEASSATLKAESIFDEDMVPSEGSGSVHRSNQVEADVGAEGVGSGTQFLEPAAEEGRSGDGATEFLDPPSAKKPASSAAKRRKGGAKDAGPDSSTVFFDENRGITGPRSKKKPSSGNRKTADFDQTVAFDALGGGGAASSAAKSQPSSLVTEEDLTTSEGSAVNLGDMPPRKSSSFSGIDPVAEALESGVGVGGSGEGPLAQTAASVEFDEILEDLGDSGLQEPTAKKPEVFAERGTDAEMELPAPMKKDSKKGAKEIISPISQTGDDVEAADIFDEEAEAEDAEDEEAEEIAFEAEETEEAEAEEAEETDDFMDEEADEATEEDSVLFEEGDIPSSAKKVQKAPKSFEDSIAFDEVLHAEAAAEADISFGDGELAEAAEDAEDADEESVSFDDGEDAEAAEEAEDADEDSVSFDDGDLAEDAEDADEDSVSFDDGDLAEAAEDAEDAEEAEDDDDEPSAKKPKTKTGKTTKKDEDDEATDFEEDDDVSAKKKKGKKDTAAPVAAPRGRAVPMLVGMFLTIVLVGGAGAGAWFFAEDQVKELAYTAFPPPPPPVQKIPEKTKLEKAREAMDKGDFAVAQDILKDAAAPEELSTRGEAKWLAYFKQQTGAKAPLDPTDPPVKGALEDLSKGKNEMRVAEIEKTLKEKDLNDTIMKMMGIEKKTSKELADAKAEKEKTDKAGEAAKEALVKGKIFEKIEDVDLAMLPKILEDLSGNKAVLEMVNKLLKDAEIKDAGDKGVKEALDAKKDNEDKLAAVNKVLDDEKIKDKGDKGVKEIVTARNTLTKDRDDLAATVAAAFKELVDGKIVPKSDEPRKQIIEGVKIARQKAESPLSIPLTQLGMSLGGIGTVTGKAVEQSFDFARVFTELGYFRSREPFIQTPEQKMDTFITLLQDRKRNDPKELADISREADWILSKTAKADDESRGKAHIVQGLAQRNLEKFAEARTSFEEAQKLIKPNAKAGSLSQIAKKSQQELVDPGAYYLPRMEQYLETKNAKAALEEANLALKVMPDNARLLAERGLIRFEMVRGQGAKILDETQKAIRADAEAAGKDEKLAAESAYIVGLLDEEVGKLDEAEKAFRAAIKSHQGIPDEAGKYRIALARILLRDRSEVAPAAPPAVEEKKKAEKAEKVGAQTSEVLQTSEVMCEHVIHMHPWSLLAVSTLVAAQDVEETEDPAVLKRLKETVALANELIASKNAKDRGQGHILLGQAYTKLGRRTDGLKEYAKGFELLFPGMPSTDLSQLLEEHPAFQQPDVSNNPNPVQADRNFGEGLHYYWSRQYPQAEAQFKQAVKYNNQDARLQYFLGLSQLAQKSKLKRDAAYFSFEQGARLEAKGLPDISRINLSLERIQGPLRELLNEHRYKSSLDNAAGN